MTKFLKSILGKNVIGITLCPFGIYTDNNNVITINHEKIHWQQQLEMLVIFFYLWYIIEFLVKTISTKDGYRNLSFEREAYANEKNIDYLKKRKHYAWMKYLKNK